MDKWGFLGQTSIVVHTHIIVLFMWQHMIHSSHRSLEKGTHYVGGWSTPLPFPFKLRTRKRAQLYKTDVSSVRLYLSRWQWRHLVHNDYCKHCS